MSRNFKWHIKDSIGFLCSIWNYWVLGLKNTKDILLQKWESLHFYLKEEPENKDAWKWLAALFSTISGLLFAAIIFSPYLYFQLVEIYSITVWQATFLIPIILTLFWAFVIYFWTSFVKSLIGDYFPRYFFLGSVFLLCFPVALFICVPYLKTSFSKFFKKL